MEDPTALAALGNGVLLPRYHSTEKHDDSDTLGEIGEKARTTAEEFLKMAKEKTDDVAEGAKETVQETQGSGARRVGRREGQVQAAGRAGEVPSEISGRCSLCCMLACVQSWPAQSH